jgi:hypothetical protein
MKAALVASMTAGCTCAFGQFYPGPAPAPSDAERVQRMLRCSVEERESGITTSDGWAGTPVQRQGNGLARRRCGKHHRIF